MMPSSARATILGHVGNTRLIKSDLMKFGLAVRNKDGSTSWFDVLTSDRYAIRNLDKGDLVLAYGNLEIADFNDRKSVTLYADEVYVLRKKQTVAEQTVGLAASTQEEEVPPF